MSEAEELLSLAEHMARSAGGLLVERFQAGGERATATKSSPTDLVSQADIDAERLIREALLRERPDDGLVGEEGSQRQGTTGLDWVVDPLDGTVNFLLGIPHWCVSIAVRDHAGPLVGVIFDPIRAELFHAMRGGEAVLDTAGGEERALAVHERANLPAALVATGFAYDARVRAAQAEVLVRLISQVRDIRRFGSAALDLAWTAAGRYDAFYERALKRWDVEAGVLICRRAGIEVVDLPAAGELPWGVLASSPRLTASLLAIVG